MPRGGPLTPLADQLRKVAKLGLSPAKIAVRSDTFAELVALPCVTRRAGPQAGKDHLAKATALVQSIKSELTAMKRPRSGESDSDAVERRRLAEVIDGVYALTPEWRSYELITHRREVLVGAEPGSGEDTRNLRDGPERVVHEELAERLLHDPATRHGIYILNQVICLVEGIACDVDAPGEQPERERLKADLFEFQQLGQSVTTALQLVVLVFHELEKLGIGTPSTERFLEATWPNFDQRERSLLDAALEALGKNLHSFLEYLETRPRGAELLDKWFSWADSTDIETLERSLQIARMALLDGIGTELLDEVDTYGAIQFSERMQSAFEYCVETGSIIFEVSDNRIKP